MTISTFERSATIAEMAVEIDRRGAVIERLEAERDALKAALEPFADSAEAYDPDEGDDDQRAWDSPFKIGDLRRARAALSPAQGGE